MEENQDSVFTEHIRDLDQNTTEIPIAVKQKLAARLRRLLRRRGLLGCSASTFGYSGKRLGDDDVFEELLMDAYLHLFYGLGSDAGKQHAFLLGRVQAGNQIDPLIHYKLREFVHDLHQTAFPANSGIHKNVKAAAKQLDEDADNNVTLIGVRTDGVNSDSVLRTPTSGVSLIEQAIIATSIRKSEIWHDVLKIVQRFSRTATDGTARGTLELIQDGQHPFTLRTLEQALSDLSYEPAENAPMSSEAVFADNDANCPEFVRTILDEHRYEVRQAKIDEFVHEGRLAIRALAYNDQTTEMLLEILHCYAEKSRHCDPEKSISQAQVARDIGLPKQTMSDYMQKLRAALEAIRS